MNGTIELGREGGSGSEGRRPVFVAGKRLE